MDPSRALRVQESLLFRAIGHRGSPHPRLLHRNMSEVLPPRLRHGSNSPTMSSGRFRTDRAVFGHLAWRRLSPADRDAGGRFPRLCCHYVTPLYQFFHFPFPGAQRPIRLRFLASRPTWMEPRRAGSGVRYRLLRSALSPLSASRRQCLSRRAARAIR